MGSYLETECTTCDGSGWIETTNVGDVKRDDEVQLVQRKCYMCGGEGCFIAKKPGVAVSGKKRGMVSHADKSKIGYSDYKRKHL